MIYLNLYERLSLAITDSQMPSIFPEFAALALQPELAASFLWAQSTLSLPPLVRFPHSTGLLIYASVLPILTACRWCHVSSTSILMFPCTGPGKTQALSVVAMEVNGIAHLQPSQLVFMAGFLYSSMRLSWEEKGHGGW